MYVNSQLYKQLFEKKVFFSYHILFILNKIKGDKILIKKGSTVLDTCC